MSRDIYSISSSLMYLQNKIDITANNIANSNTNGYKKDFLVGESFNDILSTKITDSATIVGHEKISPSALQVYTPGVYAKKQSLILERGPLFETGLNADITTEEGYFSISTPQGQLLLTTGETKLDEQGFLSIAGKGRINGRFGEIYLNDDYEIDALGNVKVSNRVVDSIKTVAIIDIKELKKTSSGDIIAQEVNLNNLRETKLRTGYLEASNVDMAEEMANLIEISRKYETSQRTMQILDELYKAAIDEVGKV